MVQTTVNDHILFFYQKKLFYFIILGCIRAFSCKYIIYLKHILPYLPSSPFLPLLLLYLFFFVSMYWGVNSCAGAYVCPCVIWRPEVGTGYLPWSFSIFFSERVSHWPWSSAGWPVSPRDPPASTHYPQHYKHYKLDTIPDFTWMLGTQTQVLMLVQQACYPLGRPSVHTAFIEC